MPRQRLIWPSIWTDEDFMALSRDARLLFVGMFSTADDHGRGLGSPASLKASIFPADELTAGDVARLSAEVAERDMAQFYTVDGQHSVFYQLNGWDKWQRPKYPTASKVPDPQGRGKVGERSGTGGGTVGEGSVTRGEERRLVVEESSDRDSGLDRAQPQNPPPPAKPDTHRGQDSHVSATGRSKARPRAQSRATPDPRGFLSLDQIAPTLARRALGVQTPVEPGPDDSDEPPDLTPADVKP